MHFGIFMEFGSRPGLSEAESFQEGFRLVDASEEMGLDGVWLAELHFNPARSVLSSPVIVASSIATRTHRLRLGMAVHVLPLNNPLRIAEEIATLDQISEGRFEFRGRAQWLRSLLRPLRHTLRGEPGPVPRGPQHHPGSLEG